MTGMSARRNRRALILLGVALVLYLAASQVVLPWYDKLRAAPAQAADKTGQLRRYRRELLHQGNYEVLTADVRKKFAETNPYFFTDASELQKVAEDSAKTVGIALAQRSSQMKKVDDIVNEITMAMTFESTPGQLVRFLDELRESPKIVNVRMAQIDPNQVVFEAPKTGELSKIVRVIMTIAGQVLVPRPEDKAK